MTLSPIRCVPIRGASPIGVEALGVPFLLGVWNGKRPDGRFNLSAEATDTKVAILGGTRAVPAGSNPAALTNSHSRAPRKPELLPLAVRESEHSVVPRVLARTDIPGANASIGTKLEALPRLASERIPVAGIACAVRNCRTTNLPAVNVQSKSGSVGMLLTRASRQAQESTNSNPTKAVCSRQWTPAAAGNSLICPRCLGSVSTAGYCINPMCPENPTNSICSPDQGPSLQARVGAEEIRHGMGCNSI